MKAITRMKQGKGVRRCVMETSAIPRNWQQFLRDDNNKKEVFAYLSQKCVANQCNKDIYTTKDHDVLVNK